MGEHSAPYWVALDEGCRGLSPAEALEAAGLDFGVELAESGYWWDGGWRVDARRRAVVRADSGRLLGVVGGRWRPLAHGDALAVVCAVAEAGEGLVVVESCWGAGGGREAHMVCRFGPPRCWGLRGVWVAPRLVWESRHDGQGAVRLRMVVEVVDGGLVLPAVGGSPELAAGSVVHSPSAAPSGSDGEAVWSAAESWLAAEEAALGDAMRCPVEAGEVVDLFESVARRDTRSWRMAAAVDSMSELWRMSPMTSVWDALWAVVSHFDRRSDYRTPASRARGATMGQASKAKRAAAVWAAERLIGGL